VDEEGLVGCRAVVGSLASLGGLTIGAKDDGSVLLSVDPNHSQRRVNGSCDVGSSIREVHRDGSVTCEEGSVGDVTSVVAGTGLTGGGTAGDVQLSANLSVVQRRIIETCPEGSSIQSVDVDGRVTCHVDSGGDITEVLPGEGLLGGGEVGGVVLSIDTNKTQVRVSGTCPEGWSISSIGIGGSVGCFDAPSQWNKTSSDLATINRSVAALLDQTPALVAK
jgi:hypothetical protein